MPVADFPIVADVFGIERAIGRFPRPFSIVLMETPAITDKTAVFLFIKGQMSVITC